MSHLRIEINELHSVKQWLYDLITSICGWQDLLTRIILSYFIKKIYHIQYTSQKIIYGFSFLHVINHVHHLCFGTIHLYSAGALWLFYITSHDGSHMIWLSYFCSIHIHRAYGLWSLVLSVLHCTSLIQSTAMKSKEWFLMFHCWRMLCTFS